MISSRPVSCGFVQSGKVEPNRLRTTKQQAQTAIFWWRQYVSCRQAVNAGENVDLTPIFRDSQWGMSAASIALADAGCHKLIAINIRINVFEASAEIYKCSRWCIFKTDVPGRFLDRLFYVR